MGLYWLEATMNMVAKVGYREPELSIWHSCEKGQETRGAGWAGGAEKPITHGEHTALK